MTRSAEKIYVDRRIPDNVFTVPQTTEIQTDKPVTVPLTEHVWPLLHDRSRGDARLHVSGGYRRAGRRARYARREGAGPHSVGRLEVSGAQRVGGLSLAPLDSVEIGGATLPVRLVTVLDLHGVTGQFDADGVLGYPFFASSEVTIDPIRKDHTSPNPAPCIRAARRFRGRRPAARGSARQSQRRARTLRDRYGQQHGTARVRAVHARASVPGAIPARFCE